MDGENGYLEVFSVGENSLATGLSQANGLGIKQTNKILLVQIKCEGFQESGNTNTKASLDASRDSSRTAVIRLKSYQVPHWQEIQQLPTPPNQIRRCLSFFLQLAGN